MEASTDIPVHVSGGGGSFRLLLLSVHISAGGLYSGSDPLKSSAFPNMSFTSKPLKFDDVGENREVYRAPLKSVAGLDAARPPDSEGTTCRRIAEVS